MKRIKTLAIGASLVLAAAFPSARAAAREKYELRLQLKPGEKKAMKVTNEQTVLQAIRGQKQKVTTVTTVGLEYEVAAVEPNGVASVGMTYKSLRVKMDLPNGSFEYDSAKPKEVSRSEDRMSKMLPAMYDAMVGCRVVMKVTPQGKVLKMEGLQQLLEGAFEKIEPERPNEGAAIKAMLEGFLSEDKLKMTGGNMTMSFPAGAVGVGESWTDKMSMSIGFPIEINTTYTLAGCKKDVGIIDVNSTVGLGEKDDTIEIGPFKMQMNFKGYLRGRTQVELATGWTERAKLEMHLSGELKALQAGGSPGGETIPMTVDSTIKIEPLKAKATSGRGSG
jgi:hypothetical protein